jgi:hypothetical protein
MLSKLDIVVFNELFVGGPWLHQYKAILRMAALQSVTCR